MKCHICSKKYLNKEIECVRFENLLLYEDEFYIDTVKRLCWECMCNYYRCFWCGRLCQKHFKVYFPYFSMCKFCVMEDL